MKAQSRTGKPHSRTAHLRGSALQKQEGLPYDIQDSSDEIDDKKQ